MNQKQKDWFAKYAPIAQDEQARSGIPASVILAQMIEETGWSSSLLARKYNNMFGVKAGKSWKGKTVSLYDRQEKSYSKYRVYDNLLDSIRDHTNVLMAKRYEEARAAASDPMKMVYLIHKAGYASNDLYTTNLQGHIKSYNLTQYDKLSSVQTPTGSSANKPVTTDKIVIDPNKLLEAVGKQPSTVVEDTFGYETDKGKEAYDRHAQLNPPETLPYDVADAVNNALTDANGLNVVGQIIRVVAVLLLIIVAIICLLKMIPGDPLSKAIALTPVGRGAAVAKAATSKVQEATA